MRNQAAVKFKQVLSAACFTDVSLTVPDQSVLAVRPNAGKQLFCILVRRHHDGGK